MKKLIPCSLPVWAAIALAALVGGGVLYLLNRQHQE